MVSKGERFSQTNTGVFSSSKVNGSGQDLKAVEGNDRVWVLVTQGWPLKGRVTGNTHTTWPGRRVLGDAVHPYHLSTPLSRVILTGRGELVTTTFFWVLGGSSLMGDRFREEVLEAKRGS